MATITLAPLLSSLNSSGQWPGDLLSAPNGTIINTHTASNFSFTYGADSEFTGYKVSIRGAGFAYDGGIPVDGTMTSVTITDASGNPMISFTGLAAGTLASDFSLFYADLFGFSNGSGGGTGPQPINAWSLLLSGNDVINGTNGDDQTVMIGLNAGNDVFNMLGGNDNINGSIGNDTIFGGDGFDNLWFNSTNDYMGPSMTQGIVVDVTAGTMIDAWGYTDQFTGIERFNGTAYNDKFLGSVGDDQFSGERGNDTLNGGSGGFDMAHYDNDRDNGGLHGITVDLETSSGGGKITGTIRDGYGNHDTVINIDAVIGTDFNDLFIGSTGDNIFAGKAGKDSFDGDAGSDTIWFFWGNTNTGVTVDLTLATNQIANDGFGNIETAVSIENIVGSWLGDHIKGSTGTNRIEGYDGKDTLTGAGGADTFVWYNQSDFGDNDVITDFSTAAGANHDVLEFHMSNFGLSTTLHLVNGAMAKQAVGTFVYKVANHTVYWDDDGTGAHSMIAIATLNGVASLNASSFDLV